MIQFSDLVQALTPTGLLTADQIELVDTIPSTHQALLHSIEQAQGPIGPKLLIAHAQSAGIGQYGRSWESRAPGSCLCLSLRRPLSNSSQTLPEEMPLHVAKQLLSALKSTCQITDLTIKPPNDIQYQQQKLAGILIERILDPAPSGLVISIGLNLKLTDRQKLSIDQPSTDLTTALARSPTSTLICNLIKKLIMSML